MSLGQYPVMKELGEFTERLYDEEFLAEDWYRLGANVSGIYSIREMIKVDENFKDKLDPAIKVELNKNLEFYKIALTYSLNHSETVKFNKAKLRIECLPSVRGIRPKVISINPHNHFHSERINKKVALGPKLEFVDAVGNTASIEAGSYTAEREYIRLHPHIVGDFESSDWVSWEYKRTKTIDDIIGAQLMEFVVKQPSAISSQWKILPEAEVRWGRGRSRFRSLFGDQIWQKEAENSFKNFGIP